MEIAQSYEATIQPGDIITIHVSSLSKEASSFFNSVDEKGDKLVANTYLVAANGNIEMPLIGPVKVAGNTSQVAKYLVKNKLEKYLIDPSVRVRIKNFKVTLLGEVKNPGIYTIPNEKVTLIEALGLAGDLTIFGKRVNLLVIREQNGERIFKRVDLTSREFFSSEFYYLHSNDIIYVEPGKGKIASADGIYKILPIAISGVSMVALIINALRILQ
jgi:polysaccharide export outer membrane protein